MSLLDRQAPCPDELPRDFWYLAAVKLIEKVPDPNHRADLRMAFEERAAICQYDGKLSRLEAERMAFHEIRQSNDVPKRIAG